MKRHLMGVAAATAFAMSTPVLASTADLEGTWTASKPQNGGMAELEIRFSGADGKMRASAACSPRPCDLGEAVAYILVPPGRRDALRDASGVSAGFPDSNGQRQVIVQQNGRDKLQVTSILSFRDGRAATLVTDNFVRSRGGPGSGNGGGAGERAECIGVSGNLRIRFQSGAWALTSGGNTIATFDSPDAAGFGRYIVQAQGLAQKCEIKSANFEYWTTSNGSFPQGQISGEFCNALDYRDIDVERARRTWRVTGGGQVLYETRDEGTADSIARTLTDNRVTAQCIVGEQGTGITYFRR